MNERPSFEAIYMDLARSMSKRSTCKRTNSAGETMRVGCAITSTDFRQVFAVGYNGNASGLANECDSEIPGSCGCLHAEENAVINCQIARDTPKIVFCTHLPCVMCAKRLINLGGVKVVYYANDYRIRTSVGMLEGVGIKVRPFGGLLGTPRGKLFEFVTQAGITVAPEAIDKAIDLFAALTAYPSFQLHFHPPVAGVRGSMISWTYDHGGQRYADSIPYEDVLTQTDLKRNPFLFVSLLESAIGVVRKVEGQWKVPVAEDPA